MSEEIIEENNEIVKPKYGMISAEELEQPEYTEDQIEEMMSLYDDSISGIQEGQIVTGSIVSANDSEVIGLVHTSAGTLPFKVTTTADNTATEVTELNTDQGLGDVFFGSTVMGFEFQAEDGALINKMTIVDSQGGTVFSYYGTVRGASGGSLSNIYNIKSEMISVPVQKGWKMYVYATSA